MSLYDSIATSYDLIFPLKPPKTGFAVSLPRRPGGSVLDIGCATGSLALELARRGFLVTGIDLDEDMIRLARERSREQGLGAEFHVLDMAEVGRRFAGRRFDALLCLGNTIVHLRDRAAIASFLAACAGLLEVEARFAVQLVSYERVISGELTGLPTIDNDQVRFSRSYRYEGGSGRVRFATELTLKATGETHRDETDLYPLTRSELESMLPSSGLRVDRFAADFTGRSLAAADESFIAILARA